MFAAPGQESSLPWSVLDTISHVPEFGNLDVHSLLSVFPKLDTFCVSELAWAYADNFTGV